MTANGVTSSDSVPSFLSVSRAIFLAGPTDLGELVSELPVMYRRCNLGVFVSLYLLKVVPVYSAHFHFVGHRA